MLEQLSEDFNFLFRFTKKKFNEKFSELKITYLRSFGGRKNKTMSQSLIQQLMEFDGAKKYGEYMGMKSFEKLPVSIYRIPRQSLQEDSFFYVAYIVRKDKKGSYQFVIHENWDSFNEAILSIIRTNKPFFIGIQNGERGKAYAKKKSRLGRKSL